MTGEGAVIVSRRRRERRKKHESHEHDLHPPVVLHSEELDQVKAENEQLKAQS